MDVVLFLLRSSLTRSFIGWVNDYSYPKPQPWLHSPATTALQQVDAQLPQLLICVVPNVQLHLPSAAAHTASHACTLFVPAATMQPCAQLGCWYPLVVPVQQCPAAAQRCSHAVRVAQSPAPPPSTLSQAASTLSAVLRSASADRHGTSAVAVALNQKDILH